MRRYLRIGALAFGSVLVGALSLSAQAPSDALRNMSEEVGGTARAQAMGGKIGALGADPTAILTNPAGSALYFKSTLTATFDVNGNYYFPYLGQRQEREAGSYWSGGVPNVSYISSALSSLQSNSSWNVNWGFQYNRDYDFTRNYAITFDRPNSTVADFIADRANAAGRPYTDYLYVPDKYDPIMQSGVDPIVTMGMSGGIIEHNGTQFWPASWTWDGAPDVSNRIPLLPTASHLYVKETGAKHSFDFNVSAGYESRFFFGASFRIGTSTYGRSSQYSEAFLYEPKNFAINTTYDNNLSVSGRSFALNLGAMYALGDFGRIGVSYLLPQYASYRELYHAEAGSVLDANTDKAEKMGYNTGDDLANSYSMWLPGKLTLSAMAYLGQWGMVTYDFTWRNLAAASLRTGNGNSAMEGPNALMKDYFGNQFGHHFGLELRPISWLSVRAGGSYTSSGIRLQSSDVKLSEEYVASGTILDFVLPRDSYSASAGLGLRFGAFSADLAYVFSRQKNEVYPYPSAPALNPPLYTEGANMDIDRHNLVGTLTLTF